MLRKLVFTVVALCLGALPASAQYVPFPGNSPELLQPPQQSGYWVQFRQPSWRQQEFGSEPEMANFIATQRSLGWEVQVVGQYVVRFRLMQWGGSRILPTLPEAQQWADMLAAQGYQPRIVNLGP
jgi:hypothetical protein